LDLHLSNGYHRLAFNAKIIVIDLLTAFARISTGISPNPKGVISMRQRDLIPFFALAFMIAWGILALFIFASEMMVRLFGSLTGQHPLFYLAVYAPAIAALTLVLNAILRGNRGPQRHRDTAFQQFARQYPASCVFPLAIDQSPVAGCTALRYLVIRGGCGYRGLVEPGCDVLAPRCNKRCAPKMKCLRSLTGGTSGMPNFTLDGNVSFYNDRLTIHQAIKNDPSFNFAHHLVHHQGQTIM
jgi:hypothetical protein